MNVNNNIQNYSINFGKTDRQMEPSKDEKLTFVLEKCKEILFDASQRRMPENGKFSKFSIGFKVPETDNQGVLIVDFDANNPKDSRILSLGVHHKNSDRLISNILKTGTKQEILEYLNCNDNLAELIKTTNHLSDKTDEYYSSL